jgi:hypothetical protein
MKKYFFSLLMMTCLLSCDKLDELLHSKSNNTSAGALDFDGVDDEVNTGEWFRYQVFTIQFWAKPGATQNTYANIIDNYHDFKVSWVIQQDQDKTNEYYFGGGALINFTLIPNVWQQVTVVEGETAVSLYINGKLMDSQPLVVDSITYSRPVHELRLGNWGGGGRNWNGQLDEVRLWNRALSKEEILSNLNCQLSGSENGLVAYYKFNQGRINADNSSITTLTDLSGNQHHGALNNFALTGNRSNFVAGKLTADCH